MIPQEARAIARYILHADPGEKEIALYGQALARLRIPSDDKLSGLALRHPVLLPYLDSGLAVLEPEHPLRHRIYVMLAILETSPSYARYFLHAPNRWWPLKLMWSGFSASLTSVIGVCIVGLISRRHAPRT